MATLATLVSVLLMWLTLPAFNILVGKQLQLGIFEPLHLAALVTLTLVCGLVSGSYPSLYLSSFNPVFVLKGIKIKTGGAALIRRGLVVLQFTVSIVLIIGTLVIYLQVQHVKSRELGLDKDRLIQMNVNENMLAQFPMIRQELINTGAVSDAALGDHPILTRGNNTTAISWPGKEPGSSIIVSERPVSLNYLSTLGLRLTEGRDFLSPRILSIRPCWRGQKDTALTFDIIDYKDDGAVAGFQGARSGRGWNSMAILAMSIWSSRG